MRPDVAKVEAVQTFLTPKKKKDVRSFRVLQAVYPVICDHGHTID